MKTTYDQPTKMMLRKHLNLDFDSEYNPSSQSSSSKITISQIVLSNPIGKVFVVGVGTVLFLFALGGLFRLLTWVKTGYIGFQKAGQ